MQTRPLLKHYLLGLVPTWLGAALIAPTGSMLPLALGGALSLMSAFTVARRIWLKRRD